MIAGGWEASIRALPDRLLRWARFPRAFQASLMVALAFAGYLALRRPEHSEMNIGAALVWQVWWPLIPFAVLAFSRLWCAVCPFALLGDAARNSPFSRRLAVSSRLRKLMPWLAAAGLLLLGFVFLLTALETNGGLTAGLLLVFAAASVVAGLVWREAVWCRYLCPVGLMIGLYARVGWLRIGPASAAGAPAAARAALRCPVGTTPVSRRSSQDCVLCGSCLQGPEGGAVVASFAAPTLPGPRLSAAESAAISLLFGLLVVDVLRMTPLYIGYMSRAVPALHGNYELAMAVGMAGVLAVLAISHVGVSLAMSPGGGFRGTYAGISAVLLPLAFAVQMGLSAQHLMITGEVLRNLGAELGLLAPGHIPPSGAYFWIWPLKLLQALSLLGGAYLALHLGGVIRRPMIVATGVATLALLFLFAQPMSITC